MLKKQLTQPIRSTGKLIVNKPYPELGASSQIFGPLLFIMKIDTKQAKGKSNLESMEGEDNVPPNLISSERQQKIHVKRTEHYLNKEEERKKKRAENDNKISPWK